MAEITMRTGVWASERALNLYVPDEWDVDVRWPHTPRPISDDEIENTLARPVGRPPFQHLCSGKKRPLIIIDDVNRPTPVSRVLPFMIRQLAGAGVPTREIKILMAGGSHGMPSVRSVRGKVGPDIYAACPVRIHDPEHDLAYIGRTSRGTPVLVNSDAANADLAIGIGGIYPNHMAGFGGGSKLALGVLGLRTIAGLHYGHPTVGLGACPVSNPFRNELDEIARMLGLQTIISVHCDGNRQPIRIACGDPSLYYPTELEFVRRTYAACGPGDADVVIANTYPTDLSLTFARKKGFHPLRNCRGSASRVALASCSEGLGLHRLYPIGEPSWAHRLRTAYWKLAVKGPRRLAMNFASRRAVAGNPKTIAEPRNPIRVFLTDTWPGAMPTRLSDMCLETAWPKILESIRDEQMVNRHLKAVIYPCAPLQFIDQTAGC